jgi:hypothetical protein
MARSSKSLELDIVTTETLFNRGIPLVPDITAYYPTMSSLSNAVYFTTAWQGQAQVFSNYFYGLSTFDTIYEAIVEISTNNLNASTSLALSVSTIDSYSTSTVAFLINSSNNWGSTPSSFQSNALLFVQIANSNIQYSVNYSSITEPVLLNQISANNFYETNYPPQLGSTIQVSQQYYGTQYFSTQEKYVLAFGNNVSSLSTLYYTQDLLTWQATSSINTLLPTVNTVEWNGSYFLMGGIGGTPNDLLISYDGIQWSTLQTTVYLPNDAGPPFMSSNSFPNFNNVGVQSLLWDGSTWFAGLFNATSSLPWGSNTNIVYSSDLLNWYAAVVPAANQYRFNKLRKFATTYYAVGKDPSNQTGAIFESVDGGMSWTQQTLSLGTYGEIYDITCSNDTLFVTNRAYFTTNNYTVGLYKKPGAPAYPDYEPVFKIPDDARKLSFNALRGVDFYNGRFVIAVEPGNYVPSPPPPSPIPTTSTTVTLITTTDLFDIHQWTPLDTPAATLFTGLGSKGIDVLYNGFEWLIGGEGPASNTLVYQMNSNLSIVPSAVPYTDYVNFQGFGFKNFKPYQNPSTGIRVVTLGVSSIVSTLLTEIFASSVKNYYASTLFYTSTNWGSNQTTLQTDLASLVTIIKDALPVFKDTGSSINSVYQSSFSTTSALFSTFDYRDETSTFSTLIGSNLSSFYIPTTAPYLSTFITQMCTTYEYYNPLLLSSWTDRFTIKEPQSTFMSIAVKFLISCGNTFQNPLPGFNEISTIDGTVIAPFVESISLSTNVRLYQEVSSFAGTCFSTFSTNFPFILGSSVVYDLNIVNSNLSSLSSVIAVTTQGLQSTIDFYNTSFEASSLSSLVTQEFSTSYWQYSKQLSSIVTTFSNAYNNANATPGVSSLFSSASGYFSTFLSTLSSAQHFLAVDYASSLAGVLYADGQYISTLNEVGSHLSTYISTSFSYSTYSSIYATYSTFATNSYEYISSYCEPEGYFYQALSNNSLQYDIALSTLITSTISITPIDTLPGYSTNLFGTYILRSTFFEQARTSTVYGISTCFTSSLLINSPSFTDTEVAIRGGVSLRQYIIPMGTRDESIGFPNYQIKSVFQQPLTDPRMNMAAQNSSILFNISSVEIRHVYNTIHKCMVGLNITPTNFALDLGYGDARKPVGALWITSSDSRVKTEISTPDTTAIWSSIQGLELVSYDYISSYIETYAVKHGSNQLGFISQQVAPLFPTAIHEGPKFGYSNFQSLDVDQIYMAIVAVTQNLLQRLSTATSKVNQLLSVW